VMFRVRFVTDNHSFDRRFAVCATRPRIKRPIDDKVCRQVGAAGGAEHTLAEKRDRRRCHFDIRQDPSAGLSPFCHLPPSERTTSLILPLPGSARRRQTVSSRRLHSSLSPLYSRTHVPENPNRERKTPRQGVPQR